VASRRAETLACLNNEVWWIVEILYVVRFDATSRSDSETDERPYDILLENAAKWIVEKTPNEPGVVDFSTHQTHTRWNGGVVKWDAAAVGGDRVLRIVVRERERAGVVFETRLTIADLLGKTSVRVSLAQEAVAPGLSPAPAPAIRQPTLVLTIASDPRLSLTAEGAVQDGRYLLIQSDDEAKAVGEALRSPTRLPILLMHPQDQGQWESAKTVARRLIGLVRVVIAGYRYMRVIANEVPGLQLPFGGAVLVWSGGGADPRTYLQSELLALGQEGLRSSLMEVLADLSVRSRGTDVAWAELRRLKLAEITARAAQEVSAATTSGDDPGQLKALRAQVHSLETQLEESEELSQSFSNDADRVRVQLAEEQQKVLDLVAKNNALSYQLSISSAGEESAAVMDLAAAPVLQRKSAQETFRYLEQASEGLIAFTPNAAKSWEKCALKNFDEMTHALVQLTRLAVELYRDPADRPQLDGRADDWFESNFGIKVSFHDKQIETHKKAAATFFFEDESWDNVPHVKVTDAKAWSDVARIHFAQDDKGRRIIVNHVGNKLYK